MLDERTPEDERITCQLLNETAGAERSVADLTERVTALYCGRGEPIPPAIREALGNVTLRLSRTLSLAILALE